MSSFEFHNSRVNGWEAGDLLSSQLFLVDVEKTHSSNRDMLPEVIEEYHCGDHHTGNHSIPTKQSKWFRETLDKILKNTRHSEVS